MIRIAFILSLLFTATAFASTNKVSLQSTTDPELMDTVFSNPEMSSCAHFDLSCLDVVEIEEDVEIPFDTKKYLPEGFNPLEGKYDLDWNKIELVSLDEDVEIGFDTKDYLPEGFNPLKGLHDLDWSSIYIVELDEEVTLGFDTKNFLPKNFCPYKEI